MRRCSAALDVGRRRQSIAPRRKRAALRAVHSQDAGAGDTIARMEAYPRIRVGISGWRYEPWGGEFYPDDLPQRLELHYASSIFRIIEINGSFYSLQRPSSWKLWRDDTPRDFIFSVKGQRFITHILQLRGFEKPPVLTYKLPLKMPEKLLVPLM